jgi:hypothetical protein
MLKCLTTWPPSSSVSLGTPTPPRVWADNFPRYVRTKAPPLPDFNWPASTLRIGLPFWLTRPAARLSNSALAKDGSTSAGQTSETVKPGISANSPLAPPGPGTCMPQSTLTGTIGPADSVVVDPHAAHTTATSAASVAALIRVVTGTSGTIELTLGRTGLWILQSIRCVPWKILVVILASLWPRWR